MEQSATVYGLSRLLASTLQTSAVLHAHVAAYGESQVVVCAEVEHASLAALHADAGVLPRGDDALRFERARLTDLVQLSGEQGARGGQRTLSACRLYRPAASARRGQRTTACVVPQRHSNM